MKPHRVAYFVSHPIQYQAPLLREIAEHPQIDLTVYFLSGQSTEAYHDEGFNTQIKWDIPLTDGYKHVFLPAKTNPGEFSLTNPSVRIASVKRALTESTWDAVWIHGYNNLALMYVIWFCKTRKLPLLFRGESNLTSSPKGLLKDVFVRQLVKLAHGLMWVSSDNRDYYQHYGALDSQLFFSPYAVNNDFFQSFPRPADLSKQQDKCIILYASKFIPRKHAPMLVQAFANLAPEVRQHAELWLVGDGADRDNIETIIKNQDLSHQVKLLGFKNQTELPEVMAACDVFVLPSEREPFGLVINEVMNFAKAIITTDEVGAARDLVADGDNGWVIDANNQQALETALAQAIANPQRLRDMGQGSLAKINAWSYKEDVQGLLAALSAIKN
ncbi:glycosyltransferase family 4 protein [Arenicella xantha]|uniref:Glycosyltransferase involved in cell wall biosynthesis n=1 Tax=Arenicella xantha TaxID=644221 RepID=A0A395JGU1_9GAMM|nr:glycosyltransferase family 4 protein [Arenicella xantha]RBP49167.1 glycosyltransferase involved in cell wall biosynthesis [Arenicella xantha]